MTQFGEDSQFKERMLNPSPETLEWWAQEAKRGNDQAFEKIVEALAPKLQATIYRILLNWEESRDVAQESFVQAFHSLKGYQSQGKFQAWLFKIGARRAFDVLRSRARHPLEV